MRYGEIQKKNDEIFRRLTGLKRETFLVASTVLREAENRKFALGGRPPDFCVEDQLLMACQYWREYRTYEHIARTYGTTKSTVQRIIVWVENTLMKSGKFNLPGKKALRENEMEFEIVMVDATESPICRPKKSNEAIILVKRNATPTKHRSWLTEKPN